MVGQNTSRTCKGNHALKKMNFDYCVDLNKCVKNIKMSISLHTCPSHSELPSNESTKDDSLLAERSGIVDHDGGDRISITTIVTILIILFYFIQIKNKVTLNNLALIQLKKS